MLYGDGAIGGVINIVTKNGVGLKPTARFEGAFGSFQHTRGQCFVQRLEGALVGELYGNAISSDGYRDNNFYRQLNGVGDLRYTYERRQRLPQLVGRQFASSACRARAGSSRPSD